MKIYTKGGDRGETSLVSGARVRKDDIRIEAYGTVDELNSFCGLLAAKNDIPQIKAELSYIQNCLFNVGSILAKDNVVMDGYPQVTEKDVSRLEEFIDEHNGQLKPLKHFIIPGGSENIAFCHICRTITRRAERRVIAIESINKEIDIIVIFLNRLSDYFFILARYFTSMAGLPEIKWRS